MLDRVTITGSDDNTDPLQMLDLSLAHPFLEWGILVSQSREGTPRYPSRKWQEQLLKSAHRMNLSMHVCGRWAREIFSGQSDGMDILPLESAVSRMQINGTPPDDISSVLSWHGQLIVQYPRAVSYISAFKELGCYYGESIVPLFDESGGEGRQVRNWSDISDCDYIGYAGGIGPDDVRETVGTIMAFRKGPFWVDMEGRVRDSEDRLDMRKVERVIVECERIIEQSEFNGVLMAAERKVEAKTR